MLGHLYRSEMIDTSMINTVYDSIIKQLQEENQKLNNNPDNISFNKEKENKIRIKIQQIIDKLDSFDNLSNNY